MARRVTPSQLRASLRQAQSKARQAQMKQRQAVAKLNTALRRWNRSIDEYNRAVRTYNTRTQSNRRRLQYEVARLSQSQSAARLVSYRSSVLTLHRSFVRVVEAPADRSLVGVDETLLDLAERETSHSIELMSALLGESSTSAPPVASSLQHSTIWAELDEISSDLNRRWEGALFALDPRNQDAARHFCASSRELLNRIIESEAPDEEVLRVFPSCATHEGRPTRRARVQFLLERRGMLSDDVEEFVEEDLKNIATLFDTFNAGTHGQAGAFDLSELSLIKQRVEHAVQFLRRVIRGQSA